MSETNDTGEKTISVAPKRTLGLKPRTERDTVRQSFSHGRTNTVQVERKKRRVVVPGEQKAEAPVKRRAPKPRQEAPPAPAEEKPAAPAADSKRSGMVLRTLSDDEIDARVERKLGDLRE